MSANYEQALACRGQARQLVSSLTGVRPTSVGVVPLKDGWAVRIGLRRDPKKRVPTLIHGVPLIIEIVDPPELLR